MLKSFLEGLDGLTLECEARLGQACSFMDLESLRVEFLGRKGKLATAMSALAQMGPEDKPAAGKKANEVKNALTAMLEGRQAELEAESAKAALAGVDPALTSSHGTVSEAVTRALAEGIRDRLGTTWALAVTGNAGPGEDREGPAPVGTCFAASLAVATSAPELRRAAYRPQAERTR